MAQETIRIIRIRGQTEGLAEAAAQLNAVGKAQDALSASSERITRSSNSVQAALDKVQRQLDSNFRSAEQMARVERTLLLAREQGRIGAERQAELMQLAEQRFSAATRANDNFARSSTMGAKSTELASYQLANLSFQIQDVVTGLATGQNPMTVLLQQGSQIAGVFGPGAGVSGVLKGVAEGLSRLVPLSAGIGGGLAAGAYVAVKALTDWDAANRAVALGLTGIGRGSGLTVGGINSIAEASARAAELSVASAREIATTLASTGRAGRGEIEDALKLTKDFAATLTGGDLSKAGEMMADVFRNPVSAADKLNDRLGFLTTGTREHVRQLQEQSRYAEAGRTVMAAVAPTLAKNAELTGFWAKEMDVAKLAWADFLHTVDRGSAVLFGKPGALGLEDDQKQLVSMRAQATALDAEIATMEERRSRVPALLKDQLFPVADLQSSRETLARTIEETSQRIVQAQERETRAAQIGFAEEARLARERVDTVLLNLRRQTQAAGLSPLRQAQEQAQREAGVYSYNPAQSASVEALRRIGPTVTELDRAGSSMSDGVFSRPDTTGAPRADIAGAWETNSRAVDAARRAQEATATAVRTTDSELVAQSVTTLKVTELTRGWTVSLQEATATMQAELATIGMSAEKSEALRKATELRNQAAREGIPITSDLSKEIERQAAAYGALKASVDQARTMEQLRFEQAQIGRTGMEQTVASQLRSAGNLSESDPAGANIASMVRLNETLRATKDLTSETFKGFASDLRHGTSAADAFTNALTRIGDRLSDLAIDAALSPLFRGSGGGIMGSLISGASGNAGLLANGFNPVGTFHTGGIVGLESCPGRYVHPAYFDDAPRFHRGGLVPGEVPAILQRGEGVFTPAQMRAMGGGGGITVNHQIHNYAGVEVETQESRGPGGVINMDTIIRKVRRAMEADLAKTGQVTASRRG